MTWSRPRHGPKSYRRRIKLPDGLAIVCRWEPAYLEPCSDVGHRGGHWWPGKWYAPIHLNFGWRLGTPVPKQPWPMGRVPDDQVCRLDKVLKSFYRPWAIKDLVYRDNPLLAMLPKSTTWR